jgi:tetratricopeptide (TPR) repeat protein
MGRESYREDDQDLGDLLRLYRRLVSGRGVASLSEEAFERIIDHFDDMDDLGSAIEAAETGIGQHPYSAVLLIKKADLLITTKKYDEAHQLLDQAEILDSNDINICILRTDAFLAQDLQERAVDLLEDAIRRFDGEERIDLLFELADVYDDYEAFDKIFDCLKMILSYQPTNEEALYKICFWTDYTGRNEESIRLHEEILDEHPYNELAWFNLAAAFQGLKLYEKAIDAYKYALVINEKFDYAYRNMADAYMRLRKFRDAIEALEKVIELARPEDVIYEAIGHCYDRLRNHAQARFYYRKASHLSPEDAKLQYRVACTYMQECKWSQAAKYLEMALRLNRNAYDFNLAMGRVQMELGNLRDALNHFLLIVKVRPRNISGWESLIRCSHAMGRFSEAEEFARLAWVQTGGKPVFRFYQAVMLLAAGRSKEALLVLESAMIEAPGMLGKLMDLEPSLLQHPQVVDIIARHRRKRG